MVMRKVTPVAERPARRDTANYGEQMSATDFHQLLAEKHRLLADGATGTTFFAMGLQSGDAPELWNVDHPERVEA